MSIDARSIRGRVRKKCREDLPHLSVVLGLDEGTEPHLIGRNGEPAKPARGYERLYVDHVSQADAGCDFDFLTKSPA